MPGRADRAKDRAKDRDGRQSVTAGGREFVDMAVAYVKQESLGPLKGLGRFVAFGMLGSMLLAVGLFILLIGLLRALQTETGSTFGGNLSWLPYLITAGAALLVAGLSVWRITKTPPTRTADSSDRKEKH